MARSRQIAVYLWVSPASVLGVLLGAIGMIRGGRVSVHSGVLEIEGPLLRWGLRRLTLLGGGADAITFGHVVLGCDAATLRATRGHERVHVRQYERWGPLFIPLYVAASAWALVSGRDPYRDNPFEREAWDLEAGPVSTSMRNSSI